MESDGRASKYYLEKALRNNDNSYLQNLFIQKSLLRINNPDIFEGSIGLMISDLGNNSILKGKGVKIGDVLYKVNGTVVNEPGDVSSIIAQTSNEDDILLEFFTLDNKVRKIAISGGSALNCKLTQLILLNLHQL